MKIDESGMNELILGLPLRGVLVPAAPSAMVAEQQGIAPAPAQDERTRLNPARAILWLAMGMCIATAAWMTSQGALMPIPAPEPKIAMLPAQPQKIEPLEVPTLKPLPPLVDIVVAKENPVSAHPLVSEDPKPVTEARQIQKKAVAASASEPIKTHPAAVPIGSSKANMPVPLASPPKETRPLAATMTPEKIDGAAIGIISASNDKLVMSVDGSFHAFRPGERLPFNEVLVSVRNGTITTDKRVIELAQQ